MANKDYVMSIRRARNNGVNSGLYAMNLCLVIAASNILKDYLEEDKLTAVLKELEPEAWRIWDESVANLKGNRKEACDAADLLMGYAERIRKQYGVVQNGEI